MALNRDALMMMGYALATAGVSICSAHGWLTPNDGVEITGVLTAFAVAFHIPNARAAAALKAQDEAVVPNVTVVAEPAGPSENMVS